MNPDKAHHTPDGFRNASPDFSLPPLSDLLAWNLDRLFGPDPVHDLLQVPQATPDLAFLRENRLASTVTWIGHATLLVQTGGTNILTDPVFSERASPFSRIGPQRWLPPAIVMETLPRIDYVVISHNHYDHLDQDSIQALEQHFAPVYLVPLGVERWFAAIGIPPDRVKALDWWEEWVTTEDVRLAFVPAQHWSKRNLTDTLTTLWGGWVIYRETKENAFRFFFAGDTGYSPEYAEQLRIIRARYGPFDAAALPIGAYEPRWFMQKQHVDPDDAVLMHRELGNPWSFAIHWGSFALSAEPLHQPRADLRLALEKYQVSEEQFSVLPMGETRRWP